MLPHPRPLGGEYPGSTSRDHRPPVGPGWGGRGRRFTSAWFNRPMQGRRLLAWAGAGAAVTALGWGGARTCLVRQATAARAVIGKPLGESAPEADRTYGAGAGRPVDLLVLGDSVAAGLGSDRPKHTLGGGLARRVAKRTGRAVRLHTAAVVGAETSDLADQIDSLPDDYAAHVAVVVVGGNDVTHRVPVERSVAQLVRAVLVLRERGTEVVVGTCPDLAALRAVPQPLRALGGRASRTLAVAQREAALAAGAYVVELGPTVGPFFAANPDEMFSVDQFHPSAAGYRRTAKAMLPSVLAALGEPGAEEPVRFGHHVPTGPGAGRPG